MSELKAGDSKEFKVGGETLIIEPIPFGSLKKLLRIIADVMKKGSDGDKDVLSIPTLLETYGDQAIPLLFRPAKHPFLNKAWIDENLTMPDLKLIAETAAIVNGLTNSFFGQTVTPRAPEAVAPPPSATGPTPMVNIESITSSESPTAGDPRILTR